MPIGFIAFVIFWFPNLLAAEQCNAITGPVIHEACFSDCQNVNVEWRNYTTDYPQITDCAPNGIVSCNCDTNSKLAICREYELPNCQGNSHISEYIYLTNEAICNDNIECFTTTLSEYNKSLNNGCFEMNKYHTNPSYYMPLMDLDTCYVRINFINSYTFFILWNCDESVLKTHSYAGGCPTTLAPSSAYSTCVENSDYFTYRQTSIDVCLNAKRPTANPTILPSNHPTINPTLPPTRDCSSIGSFSDCEWYNQCVKDKYQCILSGYDLCNEYNAILDDVTSSNSVLWIKSFIQCEKNEIASFLESNGYSDCDLIKHYDHSKQTSCYLNENTYALFCELPMIDIITINEVNDMTNIASCNGNIKEDVEFFQLILDNNEMKPIFDIGVDFIKIGWLVLNVATCATRSALLYVANGGPSVTCLGLFIQDIPELYEEVMDDMEKVGMLVLDVYEGSMVISFAVSSNQSIAYILNEEINRFKGTIITFKDMKYGNISLTVNNLIIQNYKVNTTEYYTTLDSIATSQSVLATHSEEVDATFMHCGFVWIFCVLCAMLFDF